MNPATKLAAFAAALAVLFGGAALAGAAIGPDPGEDVRTQEHSEMTSAHAPDPVRGLAVAEDGLRVVVDDAELRRGRERLRFRIVDERGETVRDFDVEHEKRMHLILARRDLTGFQHLHPEQAADGTWRRRCGSTTPARTGCSPTSRTTARPRRWPPTCASTARPTCAAARPRPTAVSDGGYDVRLDAGAARPGEEADLRFTITKDGVPVRTEPYLGAGGHLVALRDGDLAFLHVHPTDDSVRFAATFPTEGRYRLFLQFKHEGRVHTVAFTQEVS